MKVVESKYPESPEELEKLSAQFKEFKTQSKKLLEIFNQIDIKVNKIGNEINYKAKVDINEENYANWSSKDVFRFAKSLSSFYYCCFVVFSDGYQL